MNKIIKEHDWIIQPGTTSNLPIPMNGDEVFIKKIEQAIPPAL
jgi:hypothetical protein